jgi:hypothetical protein
MRPITIAAVIAALPLAGCDRGADAPRVNEMEAAADIDAVGEAASDGAAEAALRELLPLYPGARQVRDGLGGGGTGGSLAFATPDPTRPVIDFYAAAARRAGFEVDIHSPVGIALSMTATGANGGLVNVTASRVGAVTEVQAMASLGAR